MDAYSDQIVGILTYILVICLFFLTSALIEKLQAFLATEPAWPNGAYAGIYALRWINRPCLFLIVLMPLSWIAHGQIGAY